MTMIQFTLKGCRSLSKDMVERGHPSRKYTNSWQQVLQTDLILPLTKGHLPKDRIVWQKECP